MSIITENLRGFFLFVKNLISWRWVQIILWQKELNSKLTFIVAKIYFVLSSMSSSFSHLQKKFKSATFLCWPT